MQVIATIIRPLSTGEYIEQSGHDPLVIYSGSDIYDIGHKDKKICNLYEMSDKWWYYLSDFDIAVIRYCIYYNNGIDYVGGEGNLPKEFEVKIYARETYVERARDAIMNNKPYVDYKP